jgi:hypothetical protein
VSLSRLWQLQGKRADAYAMLAEVYSGFTEGFDTADLQQAKVLLDTATREYDQARPGLTGAGAERRKRQGPSLRGEAPAAAKSVPRMELE